MKTDRKEAMREQALREHEYRVKVAMKRLSSTPAGAGASGPTREFEGRFWTRISVKNTDGSEAGECVVTTILPDVR